ncbi:hypothetical protein ACSBR2_038184 [Camellia fascicularis]
MFQFLLIVSRGRYKEKNEEVAEPEVDPERDQRMISLKADERDVYDFFLRAEKIVKLPSQAARFSKVGIELSLFLVP